MRFCMMFGPGFGLRFAQTLAQMENSITESDCSFSHHLIPNAKFQPIIVQLNRLAYHKSAKVSLHPFPKSPEHPKSMNKLTLNKPAITQKCKKIHRIVMNI